jgi:hypothetical protein
VIALVPLPLVALFFVFAFFYGIASGETDHPIWQASSVAVGFMVVACIFIYYQIMQA